MDTADNGMRRFLGFSGILLGAFLLVFLVAEAAGFDLGAVAGDMQEGNALWAALLGMGLLLADIFLPTPSSLIMIANGALFGLWMGAVLSLLGSLGATLLGYGLGAWGQVALNRWLGPGALAAGKRLLDRYGMLAVMVTRPIPLLAETVAVVAGTAGMSFRKVLAGSIAGLLPTVAIYAWAGASLETDSLGAWPFLIVFGLASLLFLIGYFKQRSAEKKS